MDRNWCVYMHVNKINQKKYIGVTCDIQHRFGKDGSGYLHQKDGKYNQPYFARAILKYGWDNFDHVIIEQNLTKEEAEIQEKDLIQQYRATNPQYGYNIREGGYNGKLSEETKEKLRNVMKGRYSGENNPFWGKHHTEETIELLSRKGKEHCRDISGEKNPMYKHVFTEEELLRKSLSRKGTHLSEETKQKISLANKKYYENNTHHAKGTHRTEEQKQHMSEVMSNIVKDEKWRKNIGKSHAPFYYVCVETNKTYYSAGEASRDTNIDRASIARAANGQQQTAGGFHWKKYNKSQKVLK